MCYLQFSDVSVHFRWSEVQFHSNSWGEMLFWHIIHLIPNLWIRKNIPFPIKGFFGPIKVEIWPIWTQLSQRNMLFQHLVLLSPLDWKCFHFKEYNVLNWLAFVYMPFRMIPWNRLRWWIELSLSIFYFFYLFPFSIFFSAIAHGHCIIELDGGGKQLAKWLVNTCVNFDLSL